MAKEDHDTVGDFLEFLFEGLEGFNYIALKEPKESVGLGNPKWLQNFFAWPQDKSQAVNFILEKRAAWEVYLAPALFSSPDGKKESVKCSNVVWCEFDGILPVELLGLPEPSWRIRSSSDQNEHWYWKLTEPVNLKELEAVNRSITYLLGADVSGWDGNQVLRPPQTLNHKRNKPVVLSVQNDVRYIVDHFQGLPEPPPLQEIPLPESIPNVTEVIAKYPLKPKIFQLFQKGVAPDSEKRSSALMALGYYLAELGMSPEEMLSLLLNADERWGKFSKRPDQFIRLMEVVTRAKIKYPNAVTPDEDEEIQFVGVRTLLLSNTKLEWVWSGLLQKSGSMLLTGPPGVGKTLFALNASMNFALGGMFLDRPVEQSKIGFISMEMNEAEIKEFVATQTADYNTDEMDILHENLLIDGRGEPLFLNREAIQAQIERSIVKHKLQGIVFDSMGSTTDGSLSDEVPTKALMDWNDHIRKEYGCFTWYIHHHRKASGDNKKPNKLADVFGSQYITARASTVLCLWGDGKDLQLIPLKVRMSKQPDTINVKRTDNLHYVRKVDGLTITVTPESKQHTQEVESKEIKPSASGPQASI
jgi:hypothetical protein